jgi:hypothetical protein
MLTIAREAHLSEDDDEPFDWPVALTERDDLRAALDWAAEKDVILGLELACALEAFWGPHAPAEGVRRIGDLLARETEVPPWLRARALRNLAGAAHQERDFEVAEPSYEESLRVFSELGDARGAASVRTRLAYCASTRGDLDLARALLEDSQRDAGGRFPLIETQNAVLLTHIALADDQLEDAEASLARSWELAAGRWSWQAAILHTLGLAIALRRGCLDDAESHGRRAIAINLEEEHAAPTLITPIAGLARVALARDDLDRAGVLWGAVVGHGEHKLGMQYMHWRDDLRKEARPAFVEALARGRKLELGGAAAIALGAHEVEVPRRSP